MTTTQCDFAAIAPDLRRCRKCGLTLRTDSPPDQCHARCRGPRPPAADPPPAKRIDPGLLAERRALCLACPHYMGRDRCKRIDLGCARTWRRAVANPTASCPIGQWRRYVGRRPMPQPVSWTPTRALVAATYDLAAKLPPDVTAVAGVPRSGLLPAAILATHLHLPLATIDNGQTRLVGTGGRSQDLDQLGDHVLIVDDTIHNGGTLTRLRRLVRPPAGRHLTWAVALARPGTATQVDLFGRYLPSPHVLEWNVTNAPWTHMVAMDMDGVICADCTPELDDDGPRYARWIPTVKPRLVPRNRPVRAIISARLEKYRAATARWLAHWGAQYDELILCPATTLDQRAQMDIAKWKAEAADRVGASIYLESDRHLAAAMDPHCQHATPVWAAP